ncbi:MAG: FAD-dependent thymidylate synthase [Patescibacteria group bacterium]|jgi:hypothetical protein
MARKVSDMKVTFLGVIPVLADKTGYLKPQDLVSLSALMTFKGKSVKDLYKDVCEKGQDLDKKVKGIIRRSSLRGHASIATTPAICFTYEASKFIDSLMTGMVFSSALMASGRRTDTTVDDIVYPTAINNNAEAKAIYKKISDNNINFLNKLLKSGINKDDASKTLHYGIYGTGIIAYPIESVIAFKKEAESQGDWMPEEAQMMIQKIEKELKKYGVDLVYASRDLAGRNVLPYPNPFKDPAKINITRELIKAKGISNDLSDVISLDATITPGLDRSAKEIVKKEKELVPNKRMIKKNWRKLLALRHDFCRDYNTALTVKVLSAVSWRVWGDKKRHRTVPMTPDSLYYAIDRCQPIFEKYRNKIAKEKLAEADLKIIDRFFTIPPTIKKQKSLLYEYLNIVINALDAYFLLIGKYKIKPSDAIFIMPRGVRVDILQQYDLYNLIAGYYPVRTCTTAEAQLRPMAIKEMEKIKKILERKKLPNIAKLMVTKCQIPHFCLEEKSCGRVKDTVKDYDDKFHEDLKSQLDEEFEERLKEL